MIKYAPLQSINLRAPESVVMEDECEGRTVLSSVAAAEDDVSKGHKKLTRNHLVLIARVRRVEWSS